MTDTDARVVSVRALWKVFGPGAAGIPGSAEARLGPTDLRERTGRVAAVRDVSFDVAAGEVFVLMGLSGSGKSTLLRCLTRLIEPTAGTVQIEGRDLATCSESELRALRRDTVAMVFQHFGLLPQRRVLENIAAGLQVQGMDREGRERRAREMVELVGLSGFERAYPHELSGGMQQRVGLARALAGRPDILMLDEPFSALDPLIRRGMQDEVRALHEQLGTTMVFVTHDLREALRLGDRIAIMRDGEIVQVGRPDELVGAPHDDYVADFTRDIPVSRVLTLRWIARPAREGEPLDGPALAADTVISDAVSAMTGSSAPLRVMEGDALLGVVDRDDLLVVLGRDAGA